MASVETGWVHDDVRTYDATKYCLQDLFDPKCHGRNRSQVCGSTSGQGTVLVAVGEQNGLMHIVYTYYIHTILYIYTVYSIHHISKICPCHPHVMDTIFEHHVLFICLSVLLHVDKQFCTQRHRTGMAMHVC